MSLKDISVGEYATLDDKNASRFFLIISENVSWGTSNLRGKVCEGTSGEQFTCFIGTSIVSLIIVNLHHRQNE